MVVHDDAPLAFQPGGLGQHGRRPDANRHHHDVRRWRPGSFGFGHGFADALEALIGAAFFPSGNETLQLLLVWAGFAVGFGFRPLGAILFGYLGDKLGRKYTFLITVTLMGIATAGVGLVPSAESIGLVAPAIVILLVVGMLRRR